MEEKKRLPLVRQFSAGGIVVRKTKDSQAEILVSQHSGHHGWSFPKGLIEVGEKSEEAATREVEEETGVIAKIIEKLGTTQYFFVQDGKKILKTVTWFLMEYQSDGEAKTAWEVSDKKWLSPAEVGNQLSFKSDKEFWGEINRRVSKLNNLGSDRVNI